MKKGKEKIIASVVPACIRGKQHTQRKTFLFAYMGHVLLINYVPNERLRIFCRLNI